MSSGCQYLLCDIWEKEGRESQTAKDCILIHIWAGEKVEKNTRTALTTVADSVSRNSSWLSSREFPTQLLCVCPRSKEHTQPIPGQSKSPYILEWVTCCVSLASHFGKKNVGEEENGVSSFQVTWSIEQYCTFSKAKAEFWCLGCCMGLCPAAFPSSSASDHHSVRCCTRKRTKTDL